MSVALTPKLQEELNKYIKKVYCKIFSDKSIDKSDNPREEIRCYFAQSNLKFSEKIHEYMSKILKIENNKNVKQLQSPRKLILFHGNITELNIDAIVNPTNIKGMGCYDKDHMCLDNQIHSKAGPILREECYRCLGGKNLEPGNFFVTSGFNLPAKNIYHINDPIYNKTTHQSNTLSSCYTNILDHANNIGISQIAFPVLSAGFYGFPKDQAITISLRTIRQWFKKNENNNIQVMIIAYSKEDYDMFCELS